MHSIHYNVMAIRVLFQWRETGECVSLIHRLTRISIIVGLQTRSQLYSN